VPKSDCRIGGDGAAIEKGHSPSRQPCGGNDPTTNQDCIDFLGDFFGEKPWPLGAIRSGDFKAETFIAAADRDKNALAWTQKFNGLGYDVYFAVNPLKRPMSKKAGKADVASAQWLWVDLDPLDGAELNLERQEMLALLTDRRPQGLPEPSGLLIQDAATGPFGSFELLTRSTGTVLRPSKSSAMAAVSKRLSPAEAMTAVTSTALQGCRARSTKRPAGNRA
jgi:hypothetical protein